MKKVLSTILVLSLFILTGCSAATKDTIRTVETVKGKIEILLEMHLREEWRRLELHMYTKILYLKKI